LENQGDSDSWRVAAGNGCWEQALFAVRRHATCLNDERGLKFFAVGRWNMIKVNPTLIEALRKAHVALLQDLQGLETAVRSRAANTATEMKQRLVKTQDHLTAHFRFEEEDGYLNVVLQEQPHFERVVHELLAEHRHLEQTLNQLVTDAGQTSLLPSTFAAKVCAWIQELRHHETREDRLVLECLNTEIAAED